VSPTVVAAVVTSSAALATACGGAIDDDAATHAGERTATSARIDAWGEIDAGPSSTVYIGKGIFDWERKLGRFETRYDGGDDESGGFKSELIALPDATYTSMFSEPKPFEGNRWFESRVEQDAVGWGPLSFFGGYAVAPADPGTVLSYMRDKSEHVDLVGSEPVSGVATVHYRADLDWDRLGAGVIMLGSAQDGERPLTMEAWVDEDDVARRVRLTMPFDESRLRLTVEFSDFGVPVHVKRPPADEVITQDDLKATDEDCEEGDSVESLPPDEPTASGWTSYSLLCLFDGDTREGRSE
jgi:hypothetical protein